MLEIKHDAKKQRILYKIGFQLAKWTKPNGHAKNKIAAEDRQLRVLFF